MAGSTLWNSKGSTRGGDEWGHTGVQGVPDWRHLDLLRRPEVKRPIVRSARGWNYSQKRELQTGETSELKHNRNWYESVNSVKDGRTEGEGTE